MDSLATVDIPKGAGQKGGVPKKERRILLVKPIQKLFVRRVLLMVIFLVVVNHVNLMSTHWEMMQFMWLIVLPKIPVPLASTSISNYGSINQSFNPHFSHNCTQVLWMMNHISQTGTAHQNFFLSACHSLLLIVFRCIFRRMESSHSTLKCCPSKYVFVADASVALTMSRVFLSLHIMYVLLMKNHTLFALEVVKCSPKELLSTII